MSLYNFQNKWLNLIINLNWTFLQTELESGTNTLQFDVQNLIVVAGVCILKRYTNSHLLAIQKVMQSAVQKT